MTQPTLQTLATEAQKYFTTAKRDNGAVFIKRTDNAPDWITDMVSVAHDDGDMMPDDYRYQFIADSLDIIAEYHEDDFPEALDNAVDVSTFGLCTWLASRAACVEYLTQALGDGAKDGFHALSMAQYYEREVVLNRVERALYARLA